MYLEQCLAISMVVCYCHYSYETNLSLVTHHACSQHLNYIGVAIEPRGLEYRVDM